MKNLKWALIGIAIIGVIAYFTWNRQSRAKDPVETSKEQAGPTAIDLQHIALALSQSARHSFSSEAHDPTVLESALIIRAIAPQTTAFLVDTYRESPKQLDKDESASLILATIFLNRNRLDDYQTLAAKWQGRTAYPAAWFALNGDLLLARGKKEEAIAFLNSQEFKGAQDLPRLMRLAMLTQEKDFLRQAESKDPQNPLLPILNSHFLEKANKITEAAQVLSKSMNAGDAKQMNQAEALADLFSRYGYQPFAVSIWSSVGDRLSPETAAKALFWKRVLASGETPENISSGNNPYLQYLAGISKDEFWDANAFKKLSDAQQILETHQESYWLRLLDLIAKGKEQEALTLIKNNPFKAVSWNPQLEEALEIVLNKHQNAAMVYRKALAPSALDVEYGTAAWIKPEENPFILALLSAAQANTPLSNEDEVLLNSKNVFSAILMAEGWEKAALNLHRDDQPADYPEWYTVNVTKALAREKGADEALRFALQQNKSPELTLQVGELYLVNNRPDDGLRVLEKIRTEDNETGARAAWLSAQYYWRKGKLDIARQIIMDNHHLADTPMGQEALEIIYSKQIKEE